MNFQNKLDLQGKLSRHPLAELLVEISNAGLSGALRLEKEGQKIVIYFEDGDLVFAASNARKHKLFEILLSEKLITQPQLSEIKDFVNDLKLKQELIEREICRNSDIKNIFARQFSLILQEIIDWNDGDWTFTPLARIRDEMRQPFDFHELLFEYGRNLSANQAVQRLKSFREIFRLRKNPPNFNLQPEEAFVLSRFDDKQLTIEEIRDLSGLSETETFRILYRLWLGSFLIRQNWNAAFSAKKLEEINSAKLTLKKSAHQEDKPKIETVFASPIPKIVLPMKPETKVVKFTLEQYLEQIENAENYYESLGIAITASNEEVKSAYFALAKQFHPDLFYRNVEAGRHKQIQQAFTKIAQAYETLHTQESREVYDYKMRKNLEYRATHADTGGEATDDGTVEIQIQAKETFDRGFSLLMNEEFDPALPYLMRAVNINGDNAMYHAYYGRALAETGKRHQAEAEFQAAIKLDPEHADYRLMLARFFIEINLIKRAEGELKRLLDIAPDNYEAQTLLQKVRK